MNGALTIGPFDGANVGNSRAGGAENFFLFAKTTEESKRPRGRRLPALGLR